MIDYFKYAVDSDGICTLTIDQPDSAANVMDQNFIDSLRSNLDRAFSEDAVKGIILTSAKSSFVAGAAPDGALANSATEPMLEARGA